MSTFSQQIIVLLTVPPGNLVYHAVLAFSIFMALQASVSHWRGSGFPQGRRMVIGLSLLLLIQLTLFIGSGLAWQKVFDAHQIIPPLDRAASLLGLVVIIWLWAFPESGRLADATTLLIGLLTIAASIMGGVWWQPLAPTLHYNGSWADVIGESMALALLLGGLFALIWRRPNGWGIGLSMLLLLFGGHLAHWLKPLESSDLSWSIRLAEMAAFPLLLALPQRFPIAIEERKPTETEAGNKKPEHRRYSTDPKVLQSFLALAGETSPKKFYQDATRILSQLMLADVCLLATPPDANGHITIPIGYNLILDRPIEGFVLENRQLPVLTSAMRRGRMLRLPASSTSPELQALAKALNVKHVGHLMAVPIACKGQSPIMGVILLSPYSNRSWTVEDMQYLANTTETLASILQRMQKLAEIETELERMREALQTAQAQSEKVQKENVDLLDRLGELQAQVMEEHSRTASLAALVENHEECQDTIVQLEGRVHELETMLNEAGLTRSEEIQHLEEQLRLALEDVAILRSALQEADQHLVQVEGQGKAPIASPRSHETIVAIAQELRQPVASVVGYTDLLLGESIGILGAMQRKFVERIKASTERMSGLLEELLQVVTFESRDQTLKTGSVDLNAVIDEAVAGVIAQMSEKNITLRVNLPVEMPPVRADVDALQQVVENLLKNAGGATPADGEITLSARIETKENEPGYILLQITDSGPGILPEDLPRIFSRLYYTEKGIVQGIGDNGLGLSLAKTLVEAQGGRIWVDSDVGRGSTFSILLPLAEDLSVDTKGGNE